MQVLGRLWIVILKFIPLFMPEIVLYAVFFRVKKKPNPYQYVNNSQSHNEYEFYYIVSNIM